MLQFVDLQVTYYSAAADICILIIIAMKMAARYLPIFPIISTVKLTPMDQYLFNFTALHK